MPRKKGLRRRRVRRKLRRKGVSLTKAPSWKHPYVFQRYAPDVILTQDPLAAQFGRLIATVSDLPGGNEFMDLFDEYQLTKVECWFFPRTIATGPTAPVTLGAFPSLYTLIDINDDTAPSDLQDMRQYRTCKVSFGQRPFKRTYRPYKANFTYLSPVAVAFTASKGWVSSDYPDVPWYGLKWGIPPIDGATTTAQVWTLVRRYTIACRSTR